MCQEAASGASTHLRKTFPVSYQVFFILGVTLVSGPPGVVRFGMAPGRRLGAVTFTAGVGLVLAGWCVTGIIIEIFGLLNLYG